MISSAAKLGACAVGFAAALALFPACEAEPEFPGDRVIGTFRFEPRLITPADGCAFSGVQTLGPFVGTLSHDTGSSRAWLTVEGVSREGTLDGARFSVRSEGQRDFGCGPPTSAVSCSGTLRERIEGRLVGRFQASDTSSCDEEGADGGVPSADGGGGVEDAVLVCGFLTDQLAALDNSSCGCEACLVVYALTGHKQ